MSTIHRVAKNTAWLFMSHFVTAIMAIVLGVLIARELGPMGFGDYSIAITLGAVFVIFADIGYQILLLREVSKDPAHVSIYLNNVTGIRVISTIVVFVAMVIIVNLMGYPMYIQELVWLFGLYTLISSLTGIYQVTFRAFQQMKYEAYLTMMDSILRVGLGAVALYLGMGLISLGVIFVASSSLTLVLSIVVCGIKFVRPGIALDLDFIKKTIWIALPLSIIPIFSIIFVRVDTVLLSLMKSTEVVGWYNAAYNIVLALKVIPIIFIAALFPAAQRNASSSRDLYFEYYSKAVKYLLAMGIPLAVALTVLAQPIILLIYSGGFAPSVLPLQILAWDTLLFFIYLPLGNALLGIGRERKVALSALICTAINIALNILLIPSFGMVGSAAVTVLSELVLMGMYAYYFSQAVHPLPVHHYAVKPSLASLPAMAVCMLLESNLFIALGAAAVVYAVTFVAIGGLDASEHVIFMSTLRSLGSRLRRTGGRRSL